jgi:hypothetical protein
MSAPVVISLASRALRRLIWEHGFAALGGGGLLQGEDDIALANPVDAVVAENVRFSLWLYRIVESPYVKNAPLGFTGRDEAPNPNGVAGARLAYPPLALSLHYLLTPLGGTEEARQLAIGHAMLALHDHPIAPLTDPQAQTVAEELHIALCRLTLEELTRVWEALQAPYRLSVCYEVRVVRLSSTRTAGARRVVERGMRPPPVEEGTLP